MRFPGFSGEWKQYSLGEITELFSRRNKKRKDFPMFSVTNAKGFVNQQEQFEDRKMKGEDIAAYKIIFPSEFAYNPARINVGSIARYDGKTECMISSLYVCFKANKELVDSQLLLHVLKSPKMVYKYGINGEGGVRMYLFYPNFSRIKVKLPSLKEQHKIASFLDLIEKRISVQNKVIEDLRSLYDVICQKLYSSNEKKEWHEFKYADLLTISNERNSRLQYTNVLSASQEYGMVERGELNIDIKYDATSIKNYKIVHPNEYVIHLRSFQGGFAYSDKTGICSPAYTILVPNGKLIPAFLKYYFTSTQFINSLRIVTYGIRDGRSISVEEFLQLKISIPTISEQHYILSVMQLWEEKIRIEECHLSNLQKQKQYLLRQMFI